MKNEIDLRPREFILAHRSPRRRLAAGILAVTAAAAILLCFALAERRIARLNQEVAALRQANQALADRAAPLQRLEAEIKALEKRAALKAALIEEARPWSDHLRSLEETLPENFHLNALAADGRGRLTLSGNGPALPGIASYSQALQRLHFIAESSVSRIDLDPAGGYRFVIEATLEKGGGSEREAS